MRNELYQEQERLAERMREHGVNLVNCWLCGSVILHELNASEIVCPYCLEKSEPCDFPDYIYDGFSDNLRRKINVIVMEG